MIFRNVWFHVAAPESPQFCANAAERPAPIDIVNTHVETSLSEGILTPQRWAECTLWTMDRSGRGSRETIRRVVVHIKGVAGRI